MKGLGVGGNKTAGRVWRSCSWARVAKKSQCSKMTPLSQNHTCHIVCSVEKFNREIGDTELDRQA